MTMPDVIYAQTLKYYDLCCPSGSAKTWTEQDYKDGSEPYYSQSKVDELLERQREACVTACMKTSLVGDNWFPVLEAIRNAKIGDSDDNA